MNQELKERLHQAAKEGAPYIADNIDRDDVMALLNHVEMLEKDAARYRWLRAVNVDTAEEYAVCDEFMNVIVGEELDSAIDQAIDCQEGGAA